MGAWRLHFEFTTSQPLTFYLKRRQSFGSHSESQDWPINQGAGVCEQICAKDIVFRMQKPWNCYNKPITNRKASKHQSEATSARQESLFHTYPGALMQLRVSRHFVYCRLSILTNTMVPYASCSHSIRYLVIFVFASASIYSSQNIMGSPTTPCLYKPSQAPPKRDQSKPPHCAGSCWSSSTLLPAIIPSGDYCGIGSQYRYGRYSANYCKLKRGQP